MFWLAGVQDWLTVVGFCQIEHEEKAAIQRVTQSVHPDLLSGQVKMLLDRGQIPDLRQLDQDLREARYAVGDGALCCYW